MRLKWELFLAFLKVGTFTLGGGLAMIPLIRKIVVEEKGWLTEKEMVDCFAVSQSLPGVMSINTSIYVGNKNSGIWGAIAAAMGMILPAVVSILLILVFLGEFKDNIYVYGAFEGIKAASVALILLATYNIGKQVIKSKIELIVAISAFVMVVFAGVSAIWTIAFGGSVGLLSYFYQKSKGGEK